jgi:hypothetical protein
MSMRRSLEDLLKKPASGVPCFRRASFAEVATEAESGYAQAGRPLWCSRRPCMLRALKALRPCLTRYFEQPKILLGMCEEADSQNGKII